MMTKVDFPVESWLLKFPLYSPIEIDSGVEKAIQAILFFKKTIDCYCPECQQNATFCSIISESSKNIATQELLKMSIVAPKFAGSPTKRNSGWELSTFSKTIECTRAKHIVHFHFVSQNNSIIKIGQYPSLVDLAIGDTSQFKEVLGKARLSELNKAIGLAAHGIGIGSYAYLRRVFESLIEEAHGKAPKDSGWNEEEYRKARMKEKVSMLKNFLPEFILQHPELYSVLSIGVHELTEEACLKNFEALKSAILVIVEEKLHEIQREKRKKDASNAIKSVSNEIKKP